MPFIGQIIMFIAFFIVLDDSALPLEIVICVCVLLLIVFTQPYKEHFYTKVETAFWGLLTIYFGACVSTLYGQVLKSTALVLIGQILAVTLVIISLLYMTCICVYWTFSRMKKVKTLISRIKAWREGYVSVETDFEATLPDRVVNPENYEEREIDNPITDTY